MPGRKSHPASCITDMPVGRNNVVAMVAAGRARWTIETEAFNTLKTRGYNLEHNFGPGKKHLASVLATLNLWLLPATRCSISVPRPGRRQGGRS